MQKWEHLRDGETTIKIKLSFLKEGALGAERKIVQNAALGGKRHDNRILKLNILLSRDFVVFRGVRGSQGAAE